VRPFFHMMYTIKFPHLSHESYFWIRIILSQVNCASNGMETSQNNLFMYSKTCCTMHPITRWVCVLLFVVLVAIPSSQMPLRWISGATISQHASMALELERSYQLQLQQNYRAPVAHLKGAPHSRHLDELMFFCHLKTRIQLTDKDQLPEVRWITVIVQTPPGSI